MPMRLDWRGPEVERRTVNAVVKGTDKTLEDAARDAQAMTPVLTGAARSSIQVWPASRHGNEVAGQMGSAGVRYFIFVEIGARGRPGVHMLRRAGDRAFPQYPDNVRRAW